MERKMYKDMKRNPVQNISVPSWVIPGTYLENLQFLEDKMAIDSVELLFFIYDEGVKKLFLKEWPILMKYYQWRFSYTAHLPAELDMSHRHLISNLHDFVDYFIVHPASPDKAQQQVDILSKLFEEFGENQFLIENTNPLYMENLLPMLPDDIHICMDTGHLLTANISVIDHYNKYKGRIKEIHLHGVDYEKAKIDGRLPDHRPIKADDPWFVELLPELQKFSGVINLEVFSWEEAKKSLEVLQLCGIKQL
jgi:hypothetical protein